MYKHHRDDHHPSVPKNVFEPISPSTYQGVEDTPVIRVSLESLAESHGSQASQASLENYFASVKHARMRIVYDGTVDRVVRRLKEKQVSLPGV